MRNFALGFLLSALLFSSFFAWCPYGRGLIIKQSVPTVKTVDCRVRILLESEDKKIGNITNTNPGHLIFEDE